MKSFKSWIMQYEDTGSDLADLAGDIGGDDRFPGNSKTYYIIHNHLVGMNACNAALITFENAWKLYEQYIEEVN